MNDNAYCGGPSPWCAPHRLPWIEVARGKNNLQMTKLTSELYVDGASWYARTTIFVASTLNLLDTKVNLTLKEELKTIPQLAQLSTRMKPQEAAPR